MRHRGRPGEPAYPAESLEQACDRLLWETKHYLEFLKSMGCTCVGGQESARRIADQWGAGGAGKAGPDAGAAAADSLKAIAGDIRHCRRCRLADEGGRPVSGAGDPGARLMFVGSFPEAADEQTGVPYSGEAGELLGRIIRAIGQSRESVYVCHAVKCRPGSGRLPDRFEARACRTYLERQITAVRPELICVLGGFAAQALLRTEEPISRLRGRFHDYAGIPVMPTYGPAYLLVHPEAKRAVWEDMKQVMARISD